MKRNIPTTDKFSDENTTLVENCADENTTLTENCEEVHVETKADECPSPVDKMTEIESKKLNYKKSVKPVYVKNSKQERKSIDCNIPINDSKEIHQPVIHINNEIHQSVVDINEEIHQSVVDINKEIHQSVVDINNEIHHSVVDINKENKRRSIIANRSKGSYQCFECGDIFRLFPDLCHHLFEHPDADPKLCEKCGTGFITKRQWIIHESRRPKLLQEMPYECNICSQGFTTQFLLDFHAESHKTKLITCTNCGKGFDSGSSFIRHYLRTHFLDLEREKRPKRRPKRRTKSTGYDWHCNTCKTIFRSPSELYIHMNTHDPSDIFICMNCGVGFDNMTEQLITEHKTKHEKKLFPVNIQCDVCDEHFTELGLLLVHKKMHYGVYCYECHACHERYQDGRFLLDHFNDPEVKCKPLEKMERQIDNEDKDQTKDKTVGKEDDKDQDQTKDKTVGKEDDKDQDQTKDKTVGKEDDKDQDQTKDKTVGKEDDKDQDQTKDKTVGKEDDKDQDQTKDKTVGKEDDKDQDQTKDRTVGKEDDKDQDQTKDRTVGKEDDKDQDQTKDRTVGKEDDKDQDQTKDRTVGKEDDKDQTKDNTVGKEDKTQNSQTSKFNICTIYTGSKFHGINTCSSTEYLQCSSDSKKTKDQEIDGEEEYLQCSSDTKKTEDQDIDGIECIIDFGNPISCLSLHVGNKCYNSSSGVTLGSKTLIYKCLSCDMSFKSYLNLYYHLVIEQHSHKEVYICSSCGVGLETRQAYDGHRIKHVEEKEELHYECSLCEERFMYAELLILHHDVIHQGRDLLYCGRCERGFKVSKLFIEHYEAHKGKISGLYKPTGKKEKTFQEQMVKCKFCPTDCKHEYVSSKLKVHVNLCHPLVCHSCRKSFETRELLRMHVKDHKQDYPYKCGLCGYSYNDIKNLIHHIDNIHQIKEKDWYVCRLCPQKFLSEDNFQEHKKEHVCENCQLTIKIKENMKTHREKCLKQIKPYMHVCPGCTEGFKGFFLYKTHVFTCCKDKGRFSRNAFKNLHFSKKTDPERQLKKKPQMCNDNTANEEMNTENNTANEEMNTENNMANEEMNTESITESDTSSQDSISEMMNSRNESSKQTCDFVIQSIIDDQLVSASCIISTERSGLNNPKVVFSELEENITTQSGSPATAVKMSDKTLANLKTYQQLIKSAGKTNSNLDAQSVIQLLKETKEIQENSQTANVGLQDLSENDNDTNVKVTSKECRDETCRTLPEIDRDTSPEKRHTSPEKERVTSSGRRIKRPARLDEYSASPKKLKMTKTTSISEAIVSDTSISMSHDRVTSNHDSEFKAVDDSVPILRLKRLSSFEISEFSKRKNKRLKNQNEEIQEMSKNKCILKINENSKKLKEDVKDSLDMSGEGKSSSIDYHVESSKNIEESKPSTKKNRRNKRGSKKRCQTLKVTDETKVKKRDRHIEKIYSSPTRKSSRQKLSSLKMKISKDAGYNSVGIRRRKNKFENGGKTKDDARFKEIIDEIENKIEQNGTPQSPQELNNTLSVNRKICFDAENELDSQIERDQLLDANSSNNKIRSEENVTNRDQLLDANASNDKTCSEENVSSQTKISSEEDGVYLCEICELRMNDYTDFFNHLNGHPGKNPIICLECGKGTKLTVFGRRRWVVEHPTEHQKFPYSCEVCQSTFYKIELLEWHKRLHQGKGLLFCKVCGLDFVNNFPHECKRGLLHRDRNRNNKAHSNNGSSQKDKKPLVTNYSKLKNKKYSLDVKLNVYEKQFLRRQKLINLKRKINLARKLVGPVRVKNTPVNGINCIVCHRFFKFGSYLCEHGRSFSYFKVSVCNECGRIFKSKQFLKSHIERKHNKNKSYVCHICNYEFGLKFDMIYHLKKVHNISTGESNEEKITPDHCYITAPKDTTHIQNVDVRFIPDVKSNEPNSTRYEDYITRREGKYVCKACGLVFKTNKIYKTKMHVLRKHLGKRTHFCSICNYSCLSTSELHCHMNYCHGEEQQCKICNRILKSKRGLRLHMEKNHKESFVLDLKFKCNFCGECFGYRKDLTNHKRQYHSNVKFECSVCGHSLASARGLRKHVERIHGNDSKATHKTNKSVVSSSPVRQASVKDRNDETGKAVLYIQQYLQKSPQKKLTKPSTISHLHGQDSQLKIQTKSKENIKLEGNMGCKKETIKTEDVTTDNVKGKKETIETENVTTDEFYICQTCGSLQLNHSSLKNHIHTCHSRKYWVCNICGTVERSFSNATKHRRRMHTDITSNTICFAETDEMPQGISLPVDDRTGNHLMSSLNLSLGRIDNAGHNSNLLTDDSKLPKVIVNTGEDTLKQVKSTEDQRDVCVKTGEDTLKQVKSTEDQRDVCDGNNDMDDKISTSSENEIGNQISLSREKLFSSDLPSGNTVDRLWNTFEYISKTDEFEHKLTDNSDKVMGDNSTNRDIVMGDYSTVDNDNLKELNDLDIGIYTATRLELSPSRNLTKIDALGLENNNSNVSMLENDNEIKSNHDTDNEEFLGGQKEVNKLETLHNRSQIPKDFTQNEIDIASSLLKLDTPLKPSSVKKADTPLEPSSVKKADISSSEIPLMPRSVNMLTNGTPQDIENDVIIKNDVIVENDVIIENEVVIDTSTVETMTIDQNNCEKHFTIKEPVGSQLPSNKNNIESEIGREKLSIVLDNKKSNSNINYCVSNTEKSTLKVKPEKFDSKDIIDEVINVPNKLLTPYQTMITPPDNDKETKNTVVNLPDHVKYVDLTVANMDSDDGDVYLLFFI